MNQSHPSGVKTNRTMSSLTRYEGRMVATRNIKITALWSTISCHQTLISAHGLRMTMYEVIDYRALVVNYHTLYRHCTLHSASITEMPVIITLELWTTLWRSSPHPRQVRCCRRIGRISRYSAFLGPDVWDCCDIHTRISLVPMMACLSDR